MIQNKNSPKITKMFRKVESKPILQKLSKSPITKTTPSQSSVVITSPTDILPSLFHKNSKDIFEINMKDLIFNITDDHKTLINKNRKLAQYIVQSSNKISTLNDTIRNLENSKTKDKEELLEKLDKISKNYRNFAESHQKLAKLQKEFENLKFSQDCIIKDQNNYEEFIKFSLLDFITNFRKIQNFISINSNFSVTQFQTFFANFREEMKLSMNNFKLKLFKNDSSFEVFFKEFDKIINSPEGIKNDKNDIILRRDSITSSKRTLNPDIEINEKNSQSKTLESYNLPFKNINKIAMKKRQKSFDASANRFMDFMQNKSVITVNELEDVRSSLNSNSENKFFISRNYSQIQNNNSTNNITNKINDKTLANSLSLSEGFDLISQNNQKEFNHEERKNDFSVEKQKVYCVAKFDFVPKRKNELIFKKGEVIEITMISEEGYWQGILNGKRGLFPKNYVDKIE